MTSEMGRIIEGAVRAAFEEEMVAAEEKAWESLSSYKFVMFGYWAGVWVHLNRLSGQKAANPFRLLVDHARHYQARILDQQNQPKDDGR